MRLDTADIDEWFAAAGRWEGSLRRMDAAITAYAPDLPRSFSNGPWGAGLGYGLIDYRPRSAKETTQIPLLGLMVQKRHLALYACAVVDGQYVAELYRDRLGGVSCGKSCIRFTSYDRIEEPGLITMLQDLNERYRRGEHLYG